LVPSRSTTDRLHESYPLVLALWMVGFPLLLLLLLLVAVAMAILQRRREDAFTL